MSEQLFVRPAFAPARNKPCFCGSGARFKNCCGSQQTGRPPPRHVRIVPGFIDDRSCQEWIAYLEQQERRNLGVIGIDELGRFRDEQDHNRITEEVKAQELREVINASVSRAYQTVITKAVGREFAWFERPQVLRYEPGGWYNIHADSEVLIPGGQSWAKNIDRDISLLIYLNGDMEGGALDFAFLNYAHQPQAGDLVFFPSDHRYAHQSLPVRSGFKYAVVSWAAFVEQPRVLNSPPEDAVMIEPG